MRIERALITDEPIDMTELARLAGDEASGALVSFAGVVRNHDEDRAVLSIDYSGHPSGPDVMTRIAADFAAALEAAWESRTGSSDVVSVSYTLDPIVFTVHLTGGSPVTHIRWDSSPTTFIDVQPADPDGTPTTCSVSGRLEQLSAPATVPLNLTSDQFLVRVARDIVPD